MYFDGGYRFIGKVDPNPLASAVESLGEEAWYEYVGRQQIYQPHRRTQTIPLIYDPDGRHTEPTEWPRWAEFKPIFEPALDEIRKANRPASDTGGDGYFIRIILARLSPHGWISVHRDHGATLARSHRNHLAIITNPSVEFEVAEEVRHLPAGEIWEINNRELHGVRNTSDHGRIHMILDYVVPGERIEDPNGICIA
jgi:hypothetical protein